MLPSSHRQPYQTFCHLLMQLRSHVHLAKLEPSEFQGILQSTQKQFQQQILTLNLDELKSSDQSKLQSIQTEINKQLRLLGTDILFLQAARQSATVEQRQTQISDRLLLLIQYCEAALSILPPDQD